jgi:hypothetical protein
MSTCSQVDSISRRDLPCYYEIFMVDYFEDINYVVLLEQLQSSAPARTVVGAC